MYVSRFRVNQYMIQYSSTCNTGRIDKSRYVYCEFQNSMSSLFSSHKLRSADFLIRPFLMGRPLVTGTEASVDSLRFSTLAESNWASRSSMRSFVATIPACTAYIKQITVRG
jgi:hypothetical protein